MVATLTVGLAALALGGAATATESTDSRDAVAAPFALARHDPAIPDCPTVLGVRVDDRPSTSGEIERCIATWADRSPRLRVVEHGRSWEGRALRHLVISSPENLARLDTIRDGWARVADPRRSTPAEAERLAGELPAVAWLAFSVHGDEVSPADAGLVLVHHLLAGQDEQVESLLRELVVIVDPLMNPDGRDRFLARVAETRGRRPSHDEQAVQQRGSWPWGRSNHYLFDLNRDWTLATQPETRARLAALGGYWPLLFLDVHEMELANQTFLFYPPRAPFNPYLSPATQGWWERFGAAEATAFDERGWRYYTGEWADWWYPGYADTIGTLRGLVGILHEQAGITAGSVRLENGQLLAYREAVAHHVVAAWADLVTLLRHRRELARDFAVERRRAMADDGPLAGHTLAVVPDGNHAALRRFAETLLAHGAELHRLTAERVLEGRDPVGRSEPRSLPAGTLLVGARQPEGRLLRAMLDFDVPLPEAVLAREREALVSGAETLLYDVTGWSLPLLYGLRAYELAIDVPADAERVRAAAALAPVPVAAAAPAPMSTVAAPPVGWIVDGADDASVQVAVELLANGLAVRLADEAFALAGHEFARGSVVVLRDDNRGREAALGAAMAAAAVAAGGVAVVPVATGLAPGDGADLGGSHFLLLEAPRVALVGHGSAETTAYGALWHALDHELGLAVSMLEAANVGAADLRRYNVVVLAPGIRLDADALAALRRFAEGGGTLVAIADAAARLAGDDGPSAVRLLPDVLGELDVYREELGRHFAAALADPEEVSSDLVLATRAHHAETGRVIPGSELPPVGGDADALARQDAYAARFMPRGAILAGRLETTHWLTVGRGEELPLFVDDVPILMARDPVETPVRLGTLAASAAASSAGGGQRFAALGWSLVPLGFDLTLRLSGLLWPEAAGRLANAAYLTREAAGDGQVILFAGNPVYRGTTVGTARLFANAVVYGPGCGTRRVVVP